MRRLEQDLPNAPQGIKMNRHRSRLAPPTNFKPLPDHGVVITRTSNLRPPTRLPLTHRARIVHPHPVYAPKHRAHSTIIPAHSIGNVDEYHSPKRVHLHDPKTSNTKPPDKPHQPTSVEPHGPKTSNNKPPDKPHQPTSVEPHGPKTSNTKPPDKPHQPTSVEPHGPKTTKKPVDIVESKARRSSQNDLSNLSPLRVGHEKPDSHHISSEDYIPLIAKHHVSPFISAKASIGHNTQPPLTSNISVQKSVNSPTQPSVHSDISVKKCVAPLTQSSLLFDMSTEETVASSTQSSLLPNVSTEISACPSAEHSLLAHMSEAKSVCSSAKSSFLFDISDVEEISDCKDETKCLGIETSLDISPVSKTIPVGNEIELTPSIIPGCLLKPSKFGNIKERPPSDTSRFYIDLLNPHSNWILKKE